ncbi:LacI family DNA-binding transcriptional regulator [Snuella sedimenti]|uniref:LacI family DNA-binding transcriptional regulator n=1 Tax=Snuella sedimenti TaxID=2798802 RepID=A0A8J7LRG6_9FLAO|nr:LacI family DNA-binding transcriptional regulator [Snuella sedimenti]MBJ6367140.1 LacI family DNA-binding transcriptional regulator [Snuella sedimenti]
MKKYTIKDIAIMAGVSKGTVDRVIHNRGKVSPAALAKINAILKQIDYKPNLLARNLKNNKIYNISVLMPNPDIDPYWHPCLEGIEEAFEEYAPFGITMDLLYFNPFDKTSFITQSDIALKKQCDGIVLAPLFQKESLNFLKTCEQLNIEYFLFNNNIRDTKPQRFIGQDLYLSGRVAAKLMHTVLENTSKIAIVHIDEVFKNARHMQDKEKGFRSYFEDLNDNNFEIETFKLKHRNTNNLKKSVKYFIDMHPEVSGIFVTNSKVHLLAALLNTQSQKKHVIGYDLLAENIQYLSSGSIDFLINQNPKEQAQLSFSGLADYLLYAKETPKQNLLPIDIVNSENVKSYIKTEEEPEVQQA